MHRYLTLISPLLLIGSITLTGHCTMTVSSQIIASNVTVTGDVTMSSMTISSTTVSNLINASGTINGISHRILQVKFSSSTVATNVSTSTWTAVSNIAKAITLLNANDYLLISLTGSFCSSQLPFLTIYRDSTNLGDSVGGLLVGTEASATVTGVEGTGISIIDLPGDTNAHVYQAYIRSQGSDLTTFPCSTTGFLLLEELSQ